MKIIIAIILFYANSLNPEQYHFKYYWYHFTEYFILHKLMSIININNNNYQQTTLQHKWWYNPCTILPMMMHN